MRRSVWILLFGLLPIVAQALSCSVCGREIRGQYLRSEGRILCSPECWEKILPRCSLCDAPLAGRYVKFVTGGRERLYCLKCSELPRCFSCDLPTNGAALPDGRKLCPECAATAVRDPERAEALYRLWLLILEVSRADGEDPESAWETHNASFEKTKRFLNEHRFDALRYEASNGTDLTVGLTEGHIWDGGAGRTQDGVTFFPNIPTEEVFTSPDRLRADGVVHSALPLVRAGQVVRDFWLRFEGGEVVDFGAEQGREVLRHIIESRRKGIHMTIGMIADQAPPRMQTDYWIDFLGRPTAFYDGMETIAVRFGIPIYFMYVAKTRRAHYEAWFECIYDGSEPVAPHEITRRYAARLERMIRQRPELWVWSHKRWKYLPTQEQLERQNQAESCPEHL